MLRRVFQILAVIVGAAIAILVYRKPRIVPGIPVGPLPNLEGWLASHPKIRDAIMWEPPGGEMMSAISPYETWTAEQKADLQAAFALAWKGGPFTGVVDPLPNEVHPPFVEHPLTILSPSDAWGLYLSLIAQSLMTEVGKTVSWSMENYSAESLAILLDSRSLFKWHHPVNVEDGDQPGEKILLIGDYVVNAWVLPAHGNIAMSFLDNESLIGATRLKTIDKILTWCGHNTFHYGGNTSTGNLMAYWQYRGHCPVSRVIEGTISEVDATKEKKHWVRGCAGTEGFLEHVLRVINIPVVGKSSCDHSQPFFSEDKRYLAHGDDVFILKKRPDLSGEDLLIGLNQYDKLFGPQVSEEDKCTNIDNTAKKFPPA